MRYGDEPAQTVLSGSTLKETEGLVLNHEPLNTPTR